MSVEALLPVLIFLPLSLSLVLAIVPSRWRPALSGLAGLAMLGLTGVLWWRLAGDGPSEVALAGWRPPVGISLQLDVWGLAFASLTAVVMVAVHQYAAAWPASLGGQGYWPLSWALWAGLNGVYITADLFNTYVALELVTVAAVGLVPLGGAKSWSAALRYLFIAVLGSLILLFGVALAYAETGTLHLRDAAAALSPQSALVVTLLITLGMALKTALVPAHAWLPPAHAGAPSAVSPLMSALVIKASFLVVVRWWSALEEAVRPMALAQVVGALGALAIAWGCLMATRQSRLKAVVAYSTVAQVGYLFLLLPLLAAGGDSARTALGAVVVFALAHGLAKAAMFLAAGLLLHTYGTDALSALRGSVRRVPVAALVFGVAGVSLAGLPPTLAFAGKWQMLQASLSSGQWWWFVVVLLGGLATLVYVGRVLAVLLSLDEAEDGSEHDDSTDAVLPARMSRVALALVLLVVALGFGAMPLFSLMAGQVL